MSRRKSRYNWKFRLEALITATGLHLLGDGHSGTNHVCTTFARNCMRIVVDSRYYGRANHHESTIRLYGRGVFIGMMTKNSDLQYIRGTFDPENKSLDDYRKIYQVLERRIRIMLSPDKANDIMESSVNLYNSYVLGD